MLRFAFEGMSRLIEEDPQVARCLCEVGRCALGRAEERELALLEGRRPVLEPCELRHPTLTELGVNVVGCSACARTYRDSLCPGCGKRGLVPRPRKGRRGKTPGPAERGRRRRRAGGR